MLNHVLSARGRLRWIGLLALFMMMALRVLDPAPITTLRNQGFDLLQQGKPRAYTPAPVVIVDIDDASLQRVGQWPWPRSVVAQLLDRIGAAGAVVTGLDIIFAEPDRMNPAQMVRALPNLPDGLQRALAGLPDNDAALARAMERHPVVVGQTSLRTDAETYIPPDRLTPVPHAFLGGDGSRFLLRFPDLVRNLPVIEEQAAGRGVFTVLPDPDGIYRSVPLAMLVSDTLRLALSTEVLRVGTGGAAVAIRSNEAGIDALVIAGKAIRTASDATVRPYFSPTTRARFVSASEVLSGAVGPERLQGRMVLIGTSAIGLEDYRATPLGVSMPGVEIHAQVIENILSNSLLRRPNYAIGAELVMIAALGLVLIVLVPAIGAGWTIALFGALAVAILGGTWAAFAQGLVLLDASFPLIALITIGGMMLTGNYLREERQRQQIRSAFGQYVSPDLVSQLSDAPERLKLGGEKRELTVLFSDVRDFTSLAESYRNAPEDLTHLMNHLLTALSKAVLDEKGTIDKFMGDSVMAFWNAPLDRGDHALAACRAALNMIDNVARLNAERKPGELHINVGVGLNTGPCIVGNMGSDLRFDYTALGDTVNLASRLEGQSKPYGIPVVLGEATERQVRDHLAVMEIDLLRVKGKQEPTHVFALLGDEAVRASDWFQAVLPLNTAMIAAYRSKDWRGVEEALREMERVPSDVPLATYIRLYQTRIAQFRAVPPPEDWDGVFVAQTK